MAPLRKERAVSPILTETDILIIATVIAAKEDTLLLKKGTVKV
jgi:hypothetical protein